MFSCRAEVVRAFASLQSADANGNEVYDGSGGNNHDTLPMTMMDNENEFEVSGGENTEERGGGKLSDVQKQLLNTENAIQDMTVKLNNRKLVVGQQAVELERLNQGRAADLQAIGDVEQQHAELLAFKQALDNELRMRDEEIARLNANCAAAQAIIQLIEEVHNKEQARKQVIVDMSQRTAVEWWRELDFSLYGLLAAIAIVCFLFLRPLVV